MNFRLRSSVRLAPLAAALVLSFACGGADPVAPAPPVTPMPDPTPIPPVATVDPRDQLLYVGYTPMGQIAAGPFVFRQGADGSDRARLTATPIATAYESEPVWAPDAAHVAYIASGTLFMSRLNGTEATAIVAGPVSGVAWSPDGKSIAYLHNEASGSSVVDLLVMDVATKVSRLVHANVMARGPVQWSADGTWILFDGCPAQTDAACTPGLATVHPDGTGTRSLGIYGSFGRQLSPDGTKVAFGRPVSPNGYSEYDIYVMNTDGSNLRRLTSSPVPDVEPAWSPDGTRIAYRSWITGARGIYVMNADGSAQSRLTSAADAAPVWSPSGDRIAYRRFNDSYRPTSASLRVIRVDGTGDTELSPTLSFTDAVAWSPAR